MSTRDHGADEGMISLVAADDHDEEPGVLTEDRVLALRPVTFPPIHRLPNQHDLTNIDDEEVIARPMPVPLSRGEVLDTMGET